MPAPYPTGGKQPDTIDDTSAVKVAVLVRPLLDFETAKDCKDVVQLPGPGRIRLPAKPQGSGIADAVSWATHAHSHNFRVDTEMPLCVPD